jgi:hypothetical protein
MATIVDVEFDLLVGWFGATDERGCLQRNKYFFMTTVIEMKNGGACYLLKVKACKSVDTLSLE